ncbi:hypothetical protein, partial [Paracoccus sp. (in: a-proteobacteria)]|uniref:hypothetical protein n=1 Tax=Paracoccus sp. TaxID=267 RepID=UPI00321F7544
TAAILRRAFHENVINARSDLKHCTGRDVRRTLLVGARNSARNTGAAVLRRDADRLAATVIDTVALAGRFTGYVRQVARRAR